MIGMSLDTVVSDSKTMLNVLGKINTNMNNSNGAYSNALRKYYIFKNDKIFPKISECEKYLLD